MQTITYHLNGQVKSKGRYRNGKAIGNWFWWNESGERVREEEF